MSIAVERVDADADARPHLGPAEVAPRGERVAGAGAQRALDEGDERGGDGDARSSRRRRRRSGAGGRAGACAVESTARRASGRLWRRCWRDAQATPAAIASSCSTASVAAVPMSPSCVARRQISTSMVVVPTSPSTRITPYDVNVKTKMIDAAARIAGRSSGSVTSRNVRHGEAPSVAAAASRSGGRWSHTAPTVRTTTARLNSDVGDEDRRHAALGAGGQQGEHGGAHHDGRQHEGGDEQAGQQAPAGERVAGEDVGRGEPDDDRQHGAGDGLPQREPGDLPRRRPARASRRPSPAATPGRATSRTATRRTPRGTRPARPPARQPVEYWCHRSTGARRRRHHALAMAARLGWISAGRCRSTGRSRSRGWRRSWPGRASPGRSGRWRWR